MKSDATINSTRRDWIRASATATLALAVPGWLVAGTVRVGPPLPDALSVLDMSLAQSLVGNQFEMATAGGYALMELTKVESIVQRDRTLKSFSMEFRPVSSQGTLVQDTYRVHHPVLGDFDLMLVPHRNTRGVLVLLATFSRL